jgi:hypothetical protein
LKTEHDNLKKYHEDLKKAHEKLSGDHISLKKDYEVLNKLVLQAFKFNESFLGDSTIANNIDDRKYLYQILKSQILCISFETKLLYRGSRDGWKYADFHSRSDKKGPTITFFKVKENGRRCGGFTSISWDTSGFYKSDPSAFLFSLDSKQHFPVKLTDKAIYCQGNYGPHFGNNGDARDLSAYYEPFNSGNNCRSRPEKPTYMIPKDANGKSVLTGVADDFNAAEIECFQVIFVQSI